MIGLLATFAFSIGATGVGLLLTGKLLEQRDPALRLGISALVGLGAFGVLTFFLGLLPGGFNWGVYFVCIMSLAGMTGWTKARLGSVNLPTGSLLIAPIAMALAVVLSLFGVLAPSNTLDWDTLAYHLAVPKIWLEAGQMEFISFIHHSNFPFAIDNLYIWGLTWGGEAGAKAFSLVFFLAALIAIFGFAREEYGELSGWLASTAFAAIPLAIWLSGTAYIDVANGAFSGLAIAFAARWAKSGVRADALLAGIMVGLAAASKYTGLQTAIVVAVLMSAFALRNSSARPWTAIGAAAALAIAICAPWYARNIANTGNPVYPYFYSVFGGKNWSDYNAKIYSNEQQTFGAGRDMATESQPNYTTNRLDPMRIGASVLGIAYQPGRYINPNPTQGGGFPMGAIGFVALLAGVAWAAIGRATKFEHFVLLATLLSLGMWFFLSQQARYILGLAVPLSILAGGTLKTPAGRLIAVATCVQMVAALFVISKTVVSSQIQTVLGRMSPEMYRSGSISFHEPAKWLNENAKNGKVALYDEVFGYELDIPYMWANPGHTTELGYEQMTTGDDLIAALKRMGVTHIYLNLSLSNPEFAQRWYGAAGLGDMPKPFEPQEREGMLGDLQVRWKPLLAEAVAQRKATLEQDFGPRLIFKIAD